MTLDEKLAYYKGAVFGGPDGKPVTVTEVEVRFGDKGHPLALVFHADVASRLRDPKNPRAGADPVEVRAVAASINLADKDGNPPANFHFSLSSINRAFGLAGDDALIDDGESWERLADGHPRSLNARVVGVPSRLFFKCDVKVNRSGDDADVFWNLFAPAETEKLTYAALQAWKQRAKADAVTF